MLPLVAGKKILVVASSRGKQQFLDDDYFGSVAAQLHWITDVKENPTIQDVRKGMVNLPIGTFDAIVAFGGGSAIDFGKAMALLISKDAKDLDIARFLEEPGLMADAKPVTLIAIPTTSGTGAEVTPFATIWDSEKLRKMSLAGPNIAPAYAFIDSELTDNLPREPTFSAGLDAMNQAFESVWNKKSTRITRHWAAAAIQNCLTALPKLAEGLSDTESRDLMAEAALLAGLCISQTRTSICHAISYPLTARFGVPHGYAVAFSMVEVMRTCIEQRPQVFNEILAQADLDNLAALRDKTKEVVGLLGALPAVKARVESVEQMVEFQSEMISSTRADNFVLPMDLTLIEKILRSSWNS